MAVIKGESLVLKTIIRTILTAAACLILMGTALAAGTPNVVDQAGVLTKAQKSQLDKDLKNVNFTYGVRLAVYIVRSTHGMKVGDYADEVLDEQFGDGKNGNMVFLVAMDERQWYIATDRTMRDKITDRDGLKHIEEAVLPLLKKGNYMEAFEEYGHSSGQLLAYYNDQGKAYNPDDAFQWLHLATASVLALLVGMIFRSYLILRMSNVRRASAADTYFDSHSFQLSEQTDTFLFLSVRRIPKPRRRDNDDSGPGSFNLGGGGGGHGGRGGSF